MSLDRRQFVVGAACAAGIGATRPLWAAFGDPLGFQIFSVKADAVRDLPGTLRRIAGYGYRMVELVSFKGYAANTDRDGFGPLAPMTPSDIRNTIRDAGLGVEASHFKLEELEGERLGASINWAQGIGLKYLTISDVAPSATTADWQRNFERFNRIGNALARAGLQLGYHTHHEDTWKQLDGVMVFDALMKNVDARHLAVQLDLSTTLSYRVDPAAILQRHGARMFSLHLRDGVTPPNKGDYVNSLPLGQGEVDWKRVLGAAQQAGVRRYIVEMVMKTGPMDPAEALRLSAKYLQDFKA